MAGMALASWWLAGLAMAPLLEAYRRLEQFSADVAHELRTPLANLLALLEAERSGLNRSITPFQAGVLTPALPKAEAPSATGLDRMLNQGRRLQQLIVDLLLLASLEHPAHRSHLQRCNLADICTDVLEDFSEAAAAVTVTLEAAINVSDATVLGVESELSRLRSTCSAMPCSTARLAAWCGWACSGAAGRSTGLCRTTGLASPRRPSGGSLSGSIASMPPAAVSRGGRDWDWRSPRRLPDAMAE